MTHLERFAYLIDFKTVLKSYLTRLPLRINLPPKRSDRVLLIGNGPSFNAVNLDDCKGYDIVCVNSFTLTPAFAKLRPRTIILWDPGFNNIDDPATRKPLEALAEADFCTHIVWPDRMPTERAIGILPPTKTHIFLPQAHTYFLPWFNPSRWSIGGGGVVHMTLNLAILMGYKEIVMVGYDHDHVVRDLIIPKDNCIYLKESHFYEDDEKDLEIFGDRIYRHKGMLYRAYDPNYPDADLRLVFMRNWLFHQVFYTLKTIADKRGIRIFNASPFSWIMTFPKIDPADLGKPR